MSRLKWFGMLLAICFGSNAAQVGTILDFESLPAVSFIEGTSVPQNMGLADQFASLGVTFRSDADYAAVVNLGQGHAYRGINGIAPVSPEGLVNYRAPIELIFHEPNRAEVKATVDFVSFRLDRLGGGPPILMTVVDTNGTEFANAEAPDASGAELRINALGIHKAFVWGNGGAGLDYLQFGTSSSRREVIHFEDVASMSFFSGTPVPAGARLSQRYLGRGVHFTSVGGAAAIVSLGVDHARSGSLGFGGINAQGNLSYGADAPITMTFVDPRDSTRAATTDYVEIWIDQLPAFSGVVTLRAFDIAGVETARDETIDDGERPSVRIARAGIHKLVLTGNGASAFDDFWFNIPRPIEPVLRVETVNGKVEVSWPALADYVLETATSLSVPIQWTTVAGPYEVREGRYEFEVSTGTAERYFRLRRSGN